jgi:hypothetical protein
MKLTLKKTPKMTMLFKAIKYLSIAAIGLIAFIYLLLFGLMAIGFLTSPKPPHKAKFNCLQKILALAALFLPSQNLAWRVSAMTVIKLSALPTLKAILCL